jgi:hypothetical protein
MSTKLMRRQKKQFKRLCTFLTGPKACNFHQGRWTCDGTQTKTRKWLKEHRIALPIPAHFCDCEVFLNDENILHDIQHPNWEKEWEQKQRDRRLKWQQQALETLDTMEAIAESHIAFLRDYDTTDTNQESLNESYDILRTLREFRESVSQL